MRDARTGGRDAHPTRESIGGRERRQMRTLELSERGRDSTRCALFVDDRALLPMKTTRTKLQGRRISPLNGRLVAYASLAASCAAAPSGRAVVVYSGPVLINIPNTSAGIYLNVVTGAAGTSPAAVVGWDINLWGLSSLNLFSATGGGMAYVGMGTEYFNLAPGTFVTAGSPFTSLGTATSSSAMPLNLNSSNNYIGFRFLNEATGQTNYGWAQIVLSGTAASQPRYIFAYAYEDTGAPIGIGPLTPPMPEPGPITLFAFVAVGAVVVRAWRKRTKARGAEADS